MKTQPTMLRSSIIMYRTRSSFRWTVFLLSPDRSLVNLSGTPKRRQLWIVCAPMFAAATPVGASSVHVGSWSDDWSNWLMCCWIALVRNDLPVPATQIMSYYAAQLTLSSRGTCRALDNQQQRSVRCADLLLVKMLRNHIEGHTLFWIQ